MNIIMVRWQLKSRISNKKAGAPVDEFIGFVVFIFIAVFTLFFLSLIRSSDEKEATNNIVQQKLIEDAHSSLADFLKYQYQGKPASDIIADSYYSKDYSQIEQASRTFFNGIYQDEWVLVIKDSKNDVIFSADSDSSLRGNIVATDYSVRVVNNAARMYLPLNPNQEITYIEADLLIRTPKEGVREH